MRNILFNFLIFRRLVLLTVVACAFVAHAAVQFKVRDDYRSPRNSERPFRKSTRLILLHTTEAHAKSSLNKLSERGEAHYCVTEEGKVYRIIDREREAFHAGRSMWNGKEECDEYSVGIEVVGYHNKTMPLVQLEALKELVDRLKKIYNLRDANVICHSHVAYGAPNTWHKKRHRGRKRCGMLFAMPSVRAKLGLNAKPAFDPDVKAGRLVQADPYLNSILYGKVDTMSYFYGMSPAQAAEPTVMQSIARKLTPKKKEPAKPVVAKKAAEKKAPAQKKPEPQKKAPPEKAPGAVAKKDGLLPLPKDLHIGKMGDDVRNLEALAKLPGYKRGGPVSLELSPYKIAGAAWKSPTTYYYDTRGRITTGDKINEKSVEAGTFIFFKK